MTIYFSDWDEQADIADKKRRDEYGNSIGECVPNAAFALYRQTQELNELKTLLKEYLTFSSTDGNNKRMELRKELAKLIK